MATSPPSACRVRLLRVPTLLAADGREHALSAADAVLLARLALDGAEPRSRLAAALWPDADAERARTHLRQRLFRLRSRAGVDVIGAGELAALAPGVAVDVREPERLDEDPAALPGELLAGLTLDNDELLAWVEAARERWRTLRRDRLAGAAARHEAEGRIARALAFAARLASDEPLAEHAQRRLMRLHLLRGDAAAALVVYEGLRAAMRRELRAAPGAETEQLRVQAERGLQLPAPGAPRPPRLLHPPRLVGRGAALAAIDAARREARPVLLLGEPGIGKSRLLAELLRGRPGALAVSAHPGDAAVPYATLARVLQAVAEAAGGASALALPDAVRSALAPVALAFGPAPDGARIDPLRLRQALPVLLDGAAIRALALDDLHHADAASVEAVASLAARPDGCRPLLLASRPAELPAALQSLAGEAGEVEEAGAVGAVVRLAPLTAAEVAELLADLELGLDRAWAPVLQRHTHGNPLFLLETLREMLHAGAMPPSPQGPLPLPARVGALIEQRLSRLDERALQLARAAALAGPDFSLELAAALLECPLIALAGPWRELEQAQVLREGAFVHDLVMEEARRSVPVPVARALHRRIAGHLQAAGGVPPARLALHWSEAGDWPQAAEAWSEAASAAFAAAQLEAANTAHEAAIDAWTRAGRDDEAQEAAAWQVAALIQAASGERALEAAQRALDRAATPRQRTQALLMLAHTQTWLMRYEQALATAGECWRLAQALDDVELRCNAACRVGAALGHLGRADEALPVLEAVRGAAMREVPAGMRCEFLGELGNLQMLADRHAEAAATYATAAEQARAARLWLLARQLAFLDATTQWQCGRIEVAEQRLREAVALRAEAGGGEGMARNENLLLGVIAAARGRYGDAVALLEAAVDGFRTQGPKARAVMAENHLARVWLELGQPARARQALQTPADGEVDFVVCTRLAAALQVAPSAAAAETLRQHLQRPRLRTAQRLLGQLTLARHEGGAHGAGRCAAVLDEALDKGLDGVAAQAQALLVRLKCLAGDAPGAVALARQAPPGFAIELFPPEAALWRAQALAAAGDAAAAARASDAALAWLDAAEVPPPFADAFRHRLPVRDALRRLQST
jgi:DNA-binding SARP family transcriptional activator/tetratricopeptide (TPR) repeat protein